MMQFDTERFINEVRRHRFLYDIYHEKYKDSALKKNCWTAIGAKFRISKTRANIKWKSIRDRFMREKKAYLVRQQIEGKSSPPKWRLYDMLQSFLDNAELQSATEQNESTCTNGVNSHTSEIMLGSEESATDMNCFANSEEAEEYVSPCVPLPHSSQIPSLIYAASPSSAAGVQAERESIAANSDSENNKRCKDMEIDTQITSLLDIASNNLSQVLAVTQGATIRDDTYYYFLYIMERFRKLNSQQQRHVRHKIDQTFYDLEDASS